MKPPLAKTQKQNKKTSFKFSKINYFPLDQELINGKSRNKTSYLNNISSRYKNGKPYNDFPNDESKILSFLESFDWSKPWHAGAHFSSICVFNSTQLEKRVFEKNKEILYKFSSKIVDNETGGYFIGSTPSETELINGAMKVITGLDWLELPIHKPEKLIDYCLQSIPKSEGCDIVDLIYVLFKCSDQSDYKKNEIIEYLIELNELIFQHYFYDSGGFSYYLNKSQIYYNGLIISNGKPSADIHGTLLFVLSNIYD